MKALKLLYVFLLNLPNILEVMQGIRIKTIHYHFINKKCINFFSMFHFNSCLLFN